MLLYSMKALSHSSPHPFEGAPFSITKIGRSRSEYLEMNVFSAASFLVEVCIYFFVIGGCVCVMVLTCPGAISIPL